MIAASRLLPFIFTVLMMSSGCPFFADNKPVVSDRRISAVAILPIEYPSDIPREKVNAIVVAITAELRNRGYEVLNERVMIDSCSSPACPEQPTIANRYLVDAFVRIDVGSVSRTNFIAGYYNAIRGTMAFFDRDQKELFALKHSESMRGGLLFNSGQILQGILSTFENREQASFDALTTTFSKKLVARLPVPSRTQMNEDATAVDIAKVSVEQVKPQVFRICAGGTPDSFASVIINRQKSTLREGSRGSYCGNFYLDGIVAPGTPLSVELRSAFGNAVRREIVVNDGGQCDLRDAVMIAMKDSGSTIEIACKGPQQEQCQEIMRDCLSHRFLVFRAATEIGPYRRVAEFKGDEWKDRSPAGNGDTYYQIVAVDSNGGWSLPESPRADQPTTESDTENSSG